MTKLNPECMPSNKERKGYIRGFAYTSQGYILPCCWLDSARLVEELSKYGLFDNELKLENNKSVSDILSSEQWKKFIEIINSDPDNAPQQCKRKCGNVS